MTDGNTYAINQYLDEPAEARIKMLEAELHMMKTSGIIEVAVRNPSVSEYMNHWEGRAEAAEAKLARLEQDSSRTEENNND